MRSALSLVLAGVIAVALGVFGSVALAQQLTGTSVSEAADQEQAELAGSGSSSDGRTAPLIYGTR